MFKVSEKREKEIRQEVKIENEALTKKRAQMKRRAQRADKRVEPTCNEDRVQEQLFLLKLLVIKFDIYISCSSHVNNQS